MKADAAEALPPLRDFLPSDIPAARALWTTVFGELKGEDTPERLAATLARNPGLSVVAEDAGRLVGTVLATHDGRRGFLYHVAVAADSRRHGIGTALVRAATERLHAAGVLVIHLRVSGNNHAAIAFYERLGLTADAPVLGMRLARPSLIDSNAEQVQPAPPRI